ncbi:four helix bundle protein [Akkermansiaceae bacterium]|jgi:four helix bundle protein|nr:four helix bundle protein [Akkermansiaceae bacterium]
MNTRTSSSPDLSERPIELVTRIIRVNKEMGKSYPQQHVAKQTLRSGTAPMAHHAAAQSAESKSDFVYKLKIALKEMRKTRRWLELVRRTLLILSPEKLIPLIDKKDQLERILNASIPTVKSCSTK